ncbi:GAF domain-containing sensor histidine kinase [Bacillus sp. UNC438CL73TsuS30]|uniref:GAF domain-containing sensor histidine kinase n=1 Tax=Bacillus sp. UNC438CL73TsuS30 TaxID=1340434 RepID=UPI00047AD498|nr:GAF domain-containing sensor histidine kinase [Bacillus sp. UNC438CL73TsuS30]
MSHSVMIQKKEHFARISLMAVSIIGWWIVFQFGILQLTVPREMLILGLLVLFLFIVEFYPLPVWKGNTTISFPIVYAIMVMHGIACTLVCYAFVVFFVNLIKRRPLRIVFFNPAQLVGSLYLGYLVSSLITRLFPSENISVVEQGIIHFSLLMAFFYVINNLIVDFILLVRPQAYYLGAWKQKTIQELKSFLISYIYLILFNVLGHQNRGEIDVFSVFFFYAPLVSIGLLSSIIAKLKKEKARLKALFSISSELSKKIASPDWLRFLAENLQEFIEVDAWILWKRQNGIWRLRFAAGLANDDLELDEDTIKSLNQMKQLALYHHVKDDGGPAKDFFDKEVRSLVYAPLIFEEELVGMFVFGRSRTKSFSEEDMESAATLANQLAVLIKTKWLFAEQEKRLILEERNRIARDIHDGVAQSLAGAIMNLETAHRKFTKMPEDSLRLMVESTAKLRGSLKEVRESIYALRPYPTERVGLHSAMSTKIEAIQKETSLAIYLEKRGPEYQLSPMVEKIIFDIFQESTQNAVKHAEASEIDILVSYQKENILLKVKDNGKGFSLFQAMIKARNHPHFGILHMNEAAEKIQATLQVDSKEGAGTEITLTVPRMGIEGGMMSDKAYASR